MERVMITGDDNVFLCYGDVRGAIESFLTALADRWCCMKVAISAEAASDGEEFLPWDPAASRLPSDAFTVLVARDERMIAEWDESGYVLDESGEGPLAIYCSPAAHALIKVQILQEPLSRSGYSFEPYEATLAGAGCFVISMVTPPQETEFSRSMLDKMANLLAVS